MEREAQIGSERVPLERAAAPGGVCQSIDWYAEGESRVVQVGDVRIMVRMVGRNGRRARIAISAPTGAVFVDGHGCASPVSK